MKRTFIILLIFILAFSSFSCKKKESTEYAAAEKGEAVITSADFSESGTKEPLELEVAETARTDEAEDFTLSEVYRGGDILIRAEFTSSSGVLTFNIRDDEIKGIISRLVFAYPEMGNGISYTLCDGELSLSYQGKTEDEIDAEWRKFKTFLNSYNSEKDALVSSSSPNELSVVKQMDTVKGNIQVVIWSDRAEITVPDSFSSDEIASFISFVREKYPQTLAYGTLRREDSLFVLEYSPAFNNGDCAELVGILADLVDEYFSADETPLSSFAEQNPGTAADVTVEEKTEESMEIASPAAAKEKAVKKFSVSAVVQNTYDTRYNWVAAVSGRLDYSIKSNFSIGIIAGYDTSRFILLGVSTRYYTYIIPQLYVEGTFGGNAGIADNWDYGEYFSIASLGWEWNINDIWALFVSADFTYVWGKRSSGERFGLSFGGRIRF